MGIFDFWKKNKKNENQIIKKIKENLPALKKIGISTANCPYCGCQLAKFPSRKIKCKSCNQFIYVRTRPIDNTKVLVKENEIDIIEDEWNKKQEIEYYNKTHEYYEKAEPLKIYNYNKPQIINFVSDSDYQELLKLYTFNMYGSKTNFITLMGVYPYEKYDWETLLRIVWVYQNYCKNLQQMRNAGIKKVELICADDCKCCKSLKNKKIPIDEIKELPMKECPFEENICRARYCAVADFDFE